MDCLRYGAAFLDEMAGWDSTDVLRLPQDTALHDHSLAMTAVRTLLKHYGPVTRVVDNEVEPGDIAIIGPAGSLSHLMIVDAKPNVMWHANPPSVQWTGIGTALPVVAVYRVERKLQRWASSL